MDSSTERTSAARERLVGEIGREIRDERVLAAMRSVPREEFVPDEVRSLAYENHPLAIGYDQTISQPLIVGIMTQALQLRGEENVLEIGTGSGYQAAVLSLLSRQVVTVELVPELAAAAAARLRRMGFQNVDVHPAGGVLGWPDGAPYDAILVTAASPEVPRELLDQLATAGRLVIPVGSRDLQELVRIVKGPSGAERHNLGPCRFVPLLGRSGWPDGERRGR
jgi:protein-L-isoaspartate(D-aspartate) O-methyltransferase